MKKPLVNMMSLHMTQRSTRSLCGDRNTSGSSTGSYPSEYPTRLVILLNSTHRDLTARVFGYATVGAYYRDASSVDRLLKIRIPTFIVHAEDDPVALKDGIPYDEVKSNPYAFMVQTSHGGHLSWFEMNGERWFARTVSFISIMTPESTISWLTHVHGVCE